MNIILLSLISTIVFGIIDAIFFLFFEETLQGKIYKLKLFDMNISELITGSLSAVSAIFISSKVRISIEEENYLLKHPLLDVSGLLIGTLVVISNYIFYKRVLSPMFFPKVGGNRLSN
jgi:hypothetical protein